MKADDTIMEDYELSVKEVLKKYDTSENGLSNVEGKKRLEENGYNVLKIKKEGSLFHLVKNQFEDFLVWLLIISAVVSYLINPSEFIDSLLILTTVIINAIFGIMQEAKANRALTKLKNLKTSKVMVLRDNKMISLDSKEIVIGDVVSISEGMILPADMRVIKSDNLYTNESSLTGESKPILKISDSLYKTNVLGERYNILYCNTDVVKGSGLGVVIGCGNNTKMGEIAQKLNSNAPKKTPLQVSLNVTTKTIGLIVLFICLIVYILQLFTTRNFIESFKSAIALSVAAIPEGLQTVITMVMALLVFKLSKRKVIVKKMNSVETLGEINVIACDKTGTITTGNLKVVKYISFSNEDIKQGFIKASIDNIDETNRAIIGNDKSYKSYFDISFDSSRKLETRIYKDKNQYISYTKGAFDVVYSKSINKDKKILDMATNYTNDMYRVLLLGKRVGTLESLKEENNFKIIGMVILEDEIKEGVLESIRDAKQSHIKPIMITGDHKNIAFNIAKRVSIANSIKEVISHDELDKLDDNELIKKIDNYSVFSRANPLDKLRIIEIYKKKGMTIAMTGDGVNDSIALKNADIGICMASGSDIAKESADMILLDNTFDQINIAIYEGRRIYKNIQKTIRYLLSSNIGEVFVILIASMINIFYDISLPLKPIHLLFINVLTDSLPAIALGLDKMDLDVKYEKPRSKDSKIISKRNLFLIVVEGIIIGFFGFVSFLIGNSISVSYGQTMTFITLSMSQLFFGYIVHNEIRIKRIFNNFLLNLSFVFGIILIYIAIYPLCNIFAFQRISIYHFFLASLLSLPLVIIFVLKRIIK